ncbi:3-oxoacyl-[acyl-carrier-protein] synthase II [Stella humosa]|uniref:3-oxoacyl-[acyl-carrier-protein] synthase II n=1 Tax=Stella humosa TaxID=94 RepID=A0A3N1KV03_9PROT|nr:beta-ketoacyl-ACP synthase [Stella humosa]ROP83312.1 3-oxoacyl-[acyl-carrier-protein] synthase II [Stella humosa]BBK29905.1 beta-ketoacyl-ACP synthase II [Stella humosa]
MTPPGREVWITGVGLVSSLGEGRAAHMAALADPARIAAGRDGGTYSPFHIHPIRELAVDRFMPRRADQRTTGPWMHYGIHAAGLALEEAGVLGDAALLAATHVLTAAGGGERDIALDEEILAEIAAMEAPEVLINRRLTEGLRPTAFLAQLSNMLAGNLSIVLGPAASSRTFMGEESAGVEALRVAWRRAATGQGDLFLVAAAYNSLRADMLLQHQTGGRLLQGPWRDLWDRPAGGMCLGSMGAALVVESADHAVARGARPIARLADIAHGWSRREPGAAAALAAASWPDAVAGRTLVLSGASGAGPITAEEKAFLAGQGGGIAVRGTAAAIGHGVEASFAANVALGAWCAQAQFAFPPLSADPVEVVAGAIERVAVTAWGARRGEGLALLEPVA